MKKPKEKWLKEASKFDVPDDVPLPANSTKTAVIQYYASQGMTVKDIAKKLGVSYQQCYQAVLKMGLTTSDMKVAAPLKKEFNEAINAQASAYEGIIEDTSDATAKVASDAWESARDALGIVCELPSTITTDAKQKSRFGTGVVPVNSIRESLREALESPINTNLCGTIPDHVLASLKGQAKELSFLEMKGERDVFQNALGTSIENGWTRKQFSAVIQQIFNEGVHRVDDKTGEVISRTATASWAKTVARTELNRAFSTGEMTMYEYAGVKKIQWTSAGDNNTCEDCGAADGEIVDLGENFPGVDVDAPPAHPNCECALMPSDEDMISKRSNPDNIAWASRGGRTAEEYEAQFGFKHRVDKN